MDDFEEIYGYAAAKEELRQIADYIRDPGRYDAMGSRMPAGLLISGEPGLGKALMASCWASCTCMSSLARESASGDRAAVRHDPRHDALGRRVDQAAHLEARRRPCRHAQGRAP